MKTYTKEEALSIVVKCAQAYEAELNGKNLLFICVDKHKHTLYFELSFCGHNFMHLTGLKPIFKCEENDRVSKLHANDFYQKCLNHKLSIDDFVFSNDGTTHMKLAVLPTVICKNLHANMVGDYDPTKMKLYTEKVIGGVYACMGVVFDKKTSKYVPNTVVQEDLRNIAHNYVRVIAVYRKKNNEKYYDEMTFKAKKFDWTTIKYPEGYEYLL